ncbi:MAG: hypothetical protein WCT26_02790 [Candidatus Buchananbacteria bacterium]|jgi:hypothetical protein
MHIIIGIIVVAVGFAVVWRPRYFLDFLGRQDWVEKIFSVNDQELAYKIIGMIIIFVGALIMTNLIYDLLGWFLSPVINAGQRSQAF